MNTKLLISTHIGIEMSKEGTQSAWLSNSCIKLSVYLGREIHSLSINVNRWTRTGIIAKCDYLEEGIGVDSEFFLGMDS